MRVLVVDWLGRGGIAQTAEAWALECAAGGADVRLSTRGGRELASSPVEVVSPDPGGNALAAHLKLCRATASIVSSWRPDVVVVQNYIVPPAEELVHRAARKVGAQVVFVVHNDRRHHGAPGSDLGLRRLLRQADDVVVHTDAVGERLAIDVEVMPHPAPVGMLRSEGASPFEVARHRDLALHFGVLDRPYKGTAMAAQMAERSRDPWTFAFAGAGAPVVEGALSVGGFLDPGPLVAAVRQAAVVVLPYERATQSGAVVLAQLCGAVPLVTAVGGIKEQVSKDDAVLVAPGSGVERWMEGLDHLTDPDRRRSMASAGRKAAIRGHQEFTERMRRIVGLPPPRRDLFVDDPRAAAAFGAC